MEEEVVEVATKVAFSFKPMVTAAVGVVSLAAGVNIGLFVANRRLKLKYEKLAAAEIAEARQHYEMMNKRGAFSTPEGAAEVLKVDVGGATAVVVPNDVVEAIREYGGNVAPLQEQQNIFQRERIPERTLLESVEKFVSPVNENGPYVITHDEYMDNEVGYTQVTLTYYAGDEILGDDKDMPVNDEIELVGDALERFGDGSGDENTVFVRNTRVELDFEIVRSPGKYSVEVAGMGDDTLSHSNYPAPRRRKTRAE